MLYKNVVLLSKFRFFGANLFFADFAICFYKKIMLNSKIYITRKSLYLFHSSPPAKLTHRFENI